MFTGSLREERLWYFFFSKMWFKPSPMLSRREKNCNGVVWGYYDYAAVMLVIMLRNSRWVLDCWWGTSPDIGSLSKWIQLRSVGRVGPCLGVTQRLTDWLTGHMFLHAGFRGFTQAHERPIWVVLDSACWARKKTFHNIWSIKNQFFFPFFSNKYSHVCVLCLFVFFVLFLVLFLYSENIIV